MVWFETDVLFARVLLPSKADIFSVQGFRGVTDLFSKVVSLAQCVRNAEKGLPHPCVEGRRIPNTGQVFGFDTEVSIEPILGMRCPEDWVGRTRDFLQGTVLVPEGVLGKLWFLGWRLWPFLVFHALSSTIWSINQSHDEVLGEGLPGVDFGSPSWSLLELGSRCQGMNKILGVWETLSKLLTYEVLKGCSTKLQCCRRCPTSKDQR